MTIEKGRLERLREFFFEATEYIWTHDCMDALTLSSVVGKLQSIFAVTQGGALKLRHLTAALVDPGILLTWQRGIRRSIWVPLGKPQKEEVRWWVNCLGNSEPPSTLAWIDGPENLFFFKHRSFLKSYNSIFTSWPCHRIVNMRVGACTDVGCGGPLHWKTVSGQPRTLRMAWPWDEFSREFIGWLPVSKLALWHINTREFATIVAIIILHFSKWKDSGFAFSVFLNKLIWVETDKITAMHYSDVRYGSSDLNTGLAGSLQKHLEFFGSALIATHRPGVDNVVADSLCRELWTASDHTWNWSLPVRRFSSILATLGLARMDWDLMANSQNTGAQNFIDEYGDLFVQEVRNLLGPLAYGWVLPPVSLMRQTIKWLNRWVSMAQDHRRVALAILVNNAFVPARDTESWYKVGTLNNAVAQSMRQACTIPVHEELQRKMDSGKWVVFTSKPFRKRKNTEATPPSRKMARK